MAHLVMSDFLVAHEIDLMIPGSEIDARRAEFQKLTGKARCRADYVKGLAAFCGLDLIEYDTADVKWEQPKNKDQGRFRVKLRSKYWRDRLPQNR
jgi:hypothetical protein